MKLLVVAPGGRGSGRSYALARLAAVMPQALLIDVHSYEYSGQRHLYRQDQHIIDPFHRRGDQLTISGHVRERIRGASVILLVGDQDVDLMIAAVQEFGPFDVIYASSLPTKRVTPTWLHHGNGDGLNLAR